MNHTYELVFELDQDDRITSRIETKATAPSPVPAHGCVPKIMLDDFSSRHPGIWKDVDRMRNEIARTQGIPPWCFMPEQGWINLVFSRLCGGDVNSFLAAIQTDANAIIDCERTCSEAAFFGAWRTTQGVYRFDPTLFAELVATPVSGAIPTDILKHLPEWAVYVETPGLFHPNGLPLLGIGARLGTHALGDFLDIHLFVRLPNGRIDRGSHTVVLNGGTVEDSFNLIDSESERIITSLGMTGRKPALDADAWNECVSRILSLLLWLCSEEPEIGTAPPVRPAPVRTKKGVRMFAADKPTVWPVGVRIGSTLAAAKAISKARNEPGDGTHASPRGHVRRAHWHTFLTGRKENPTRILRWLSPILVNVRNDGDLPAVIHQVI